MRVLHGRYAARYRAILKAAIPASVIIVVGLLIIAARPKPLASTQTSPPLHQAILFAYWSEDDGFTSTVIINNPSSTQLIVNPTIHNPSGQPLSVSPIVLEPQRQLRANVADWIAQAGGDASFRQGNIILDYQAPHAYLGGRLIVANPASSLSFDVLNDMPMSFVSSRLEGMWWRPDSASQYRLVLSSMSDSSVSVTANFFGDQGPTRDQSLTRTLAPHETQVINLSDLQIPFTTSPQAGKLGGVAITHTGNPGVVLAYGMLAKRQAGFSSHFAFHDPAERRSQTLAAAHMLVGKPDLPGFSPQTSFTSIALLRNVSDAAIEVTPKVSFTSNGQPRTVALSNRHLLPQQVDSVDVGPELRRAGFRAAIVGAGLTLTSTGAPGALAAHLTSFDQSRNHTFDVPIKDTGIAMNRFGGSYPWRIDGDFQSVVHVRNTTDEESRFTIQLDYDGGSYALPMQELAPQQETAIDIRELRDSQTPDSIGRTIPLTLTSGQANWYESGRQALTGRAEVFSAGAGVASSFSCGPPCCPPATFLVFCTPDSLGGLPGNSGPVQLFQTRRRDCDGAEFGPYNVTASASWSSDNTSVVTVGAVGLSGAQCTWVEVGQANVTAAFDGIDYQFAPEEGGNCTPFIVPIIISCPVTVVQVIDVTAQGAIKVTSVVGNQSIIHFVTPKGASNENVTLTATIAPNNQASANTITWEGATQTPTDKLKATVSKGSSSKKVVKVKVSGQTAKELRVWVVWGTITSTDAFPISYQQTPNLGILSGGYKFVHTIQPGSIITDSNRPDLSGPKTIDPPGIHWTGQSLAGGADKKWDNSRQIRTKWILPAGLTVSQCCGDLPDGLTYPTDEVEGNDDTSTGEENNDPYNNGGKLNGEDKPTNGALHGAGNEGDTIELRMHFREFTRLEIGGSWYRISDYYLWRIHFKWRKSNGKWINNGSNKALNNNGF